MSNHKLEMRFMIRKDFPTILEIERLAYGDDAWDEKVFITELRKRSVIGSTCVHKTRPEIYGFVVYELHSTHYQILNIAVHPMYQHQGVGTYILNSIVKKLSGPRQMIRVDVFEDNMDALLFLRSHNFIAVGIHKFENSVDGIAMEYGSQYWHPANRISRYYAKP